MKQNLVIFIFFLLSACSTFKNNSDTNLDVAAQDHAALGLTYLAQDDPVTAKAELWQALQLAPNSVAVLDAVAYYFEQIHDLAQAQLYYQKALHIAPHSGQALNNYGAFLCHEGNYQSGLNYLVLAAEQFNYLASADAYANASYCAAALGDQSLAQKYLKLALAQKPNVDIKQT